jgi:hypothetical protein
MQETPIWPDPARGSGPPIPEMTRPYADPWVIVSRICHDLKRDGTKLFFPADLDWGEAVRHAAALIECLGAHAGTPGETDPQ